MKNLIFPRIIGSSSFMGLALLSSLFGFSSYGSFHPDRYTDNVFENELRQPTMNLERQILLARDQLKLPHLGWSDLNLLSDLAEVKSTRLFQDKHSEFSRNNSRARVKAFIFAQLLRVALLSQGHKREWLFEEKITSPLASSHLRINPDWYGTIEIVNSTHFIWIPEPKLEEFPLVKELANTLSVAFQLEPKLKLFSEVSLPLFQHTHIGQSLIATLAMEDLFYRMMQFDFFRRAVEEDFLMHDLEPSNPSDNERTFLLKKLKATKLKTRSEYLRSEMLAILPTVVFLSPDFFNEITIWMDSLIEGFTFHTEGLGLEAYKTEFSKQNQLDKQDPFSLARRKTELVRKNQFFDYSLVQDFISGNARGTCRPRIVR